MITLFIDTCHHNLIVGVYKDTEELILMHEDNDNHLSERLLPLIEKAMNSINLDINNVDNIIVANGPGSFTGVRIGVTVAKTLAYSLGCPIHAVSELLVMSSGNYTTKYVVPLIDARRDAVYGAMYSNDNSIINDSYILLSELLNEVKIKVSLDDVTFVSYENFDNINIKIPKIDLTQIIKDSLGSEGTLCHLVNPNYLKKTEAEEKLGA